MKRVFLNPYFIVIEVSLFAFFSLFYHYLFFPYSSNSSSFLLKEVVRFLLLFFSILLLISIILSLRIFLIRFKKKPSISPLGAFFFTWVF